MNKLNYAQVLLETETGVYLKGTHTNRAGEHCALFSGEPFYQTELLQVHLKGVQFFIDGELICTHELDRYMRHGGIELFKFTTDGDMVYG